ncbi:MAG: integrase [Rhizobiales bacterium NRL2]|jgi:integrase|nr:MAG: integrase [Rhizobiales bacterium NRL2]
MADTINRLNARQVQTQPVGRHHDGGGLYLQVIESGARTWLFRYMLDGKQRWMGLGSARDVPLKEAREKAMEYRRLRAEGIDPIKYRDRERQRRREDLLSSVTFQKAAEEYIRSHEAGWSNPAHASQWANSLRDHAYPIIGDKDVAEISMSDVLRVLDPIWLTKTVTATRVRGRIEKILDWARVRGHRVGENPARWRGNLETQLAPPNRVRRVEHHKALPWSEIGDFMAELRERKSIAAYALEFMILTALRTSEVVDARWEEFDLGNAVWTVPAERMKMKNEHRVPLTARAIDILRELERSSTGDHVFTSGDGRSLHKNTMLALVRRMGRKDITAHGFRSTFRDWAAEMTAYPSDVVEMALAHAIRNKVESAYRRGDLFEKRKRLMDEWAQFCNTPSRNEVRSANVVWINQ